jgi:hypothetical protein
MADCIQSKPEARNVDYIFATAWFTQAIQAGNISGWMEIYAPDPIHEFPFGLTGAVRFIHLQKANALNGDNDGHQASTSSI